ncbi:MAG TPA: hypothetical protein VJ044_10080 [Candidatus Hodarchaeales archaeon]|nr:hypothetical protein [Candidatus Hodarchaeales archaeon]
MKTERGQVELGCVFLLVALVLLCGVFFVESPGAGPCFPLPCPEGTSGPVGMSVSENIGWLCALPFAGGGGAAFLYLWFKWRASRWN